LQAEQRVDGLTSVNAKLRAAVLYLGAEMAKHDRSDR
jgi:hypothetical protein